MPCLGELTNRICNHPIGSLGSTTDGLSASECRVLRNGGRQRHQSASEFRVLRRDLSVCPHCCLPLFIFRESDSESVESVKESLSESLTLLILFQSLRVFTLSQSLRVFTLSSPLRVVTLSLSLAIRVFTLSLSLRVFTLSQSLRVVTRRHFPNHSGLSLRVLTLSLSPRVLTLS